MYDLLVKNGYLIDPGSEIKGVFDVGIRDGIVQRIAPDIEESKAIRVIDVSGRLVTPGLIDLHTHVYEGVNRMGVHPDLAGVSSGVCTVVDAGSAGSHTIGGMAKYVAHQAITRVFAMLHLGRTGLAAMPEIRAREDIDVETSIAAIQEHQPLLQGVKLRLVGPGIRDLGTEAVLLGKQVTNETDTRLMVHIGDPDGLVPSQVTRAMLLLMGPKDIVTHFFSGNPGNVLDANNRVWPEVKEAQDHGVTFDCAHGTKNFSFGAIQHILDQGFRPHTISTDITILGRRTLVGSLTEVMSKFLALGFSIEEVVRMTTTNPARALGMENVLGSLSEGREADITVLRIEENTFSFRDTMGGKLQGEKAFAPVLAVRKGQTIPLDWGPHPWGWLPEQE